jgi:hypothetical protein
VKDGAAVSVEALMREVEAGVRADRRRRSLARGGPDEYRDEALFEAVERVLRRALEARDRDVLLIPELAGDDEWRLETHLTFASHRSVLGPAIVFVKRRLLLPMMRWLYEFNLENFRRQAQVNRMLFACVEELAIENARLRLDVAAGTVAAERADRSGTERDGRKDADR